MTRDWKTAEEWSELRRIERRRLGFLEVVSWGVEDLSFPIRRGDIFPMSLFNARLAPARVVAVRWDEVHPKGRKGEEVGLIDQNEWTCWRIKADELKAVYINYGRQLHRLDQAEVDVVVAAYHLAQEAERDEGLRWGDEPAHELSPGLAGVIQRRRP